MLTITKSLRCINVPQPRSPLEAINSCKHSVIIEEGLYAIRDQSAIRADLDPFPDFKAITRISKYLVYLIPGYDLGYKRDHIIKLANTKFRSQRGENKIISSSAPTEYQYHE